MAQLGLEVARLGVGEHAVAIYICFGMCEQQRGGELGRVHAGDVLAARLGGARAAEGDQRK